MALQDFLPSLKVAMKHPRAGDISEPSAVRVAMACTIWRLLLGTFKVARCFTITSAPVSGSMCIWDDMSMDNWIQTGLGERASVSVTSDVLRHALTVRVAGVNGGRAVAAFIFERQHFS